MNTTEDSMEVDTVDGVLLSTDEVKVLMRHCDTEGAIILLHALRPASITWTNKQTAQAIGKSASGVNRAKGKLRKEGLALRSDDQEMITLIRRRSHDQQMIRGDQEMIMQSDQQTITPDQEMITLISRRSPQAHIIRTRATGAGAPAHPRHKADPVGDHAKEQQHQHQHQHNPPSGGVGVVNHDLLRGGLGGEAVSSQGRAQEVAGELAAWWVHWQEQGALLEGTAPDAGQLRRWRLPLEPARVRTAMAWLLWKTRPGRKGVLCNAGIWKSMVEDTLSDEADLNYKTVLDGDIDFGAIFAGVLPGQQPRVKSPPTAQKAPQGAAQATSATPQTQQGVAGQVFQAVPGLEPTDPGAAPEDWEERERVRKRIMQTCERIGRAAREQKISELVTDAARLAGRACEMISNPGEYQSVVDDFGAMAKKAGLDPQEVLRGDV